MRPVGKRLRAREEIFNHCAIKATYLCKQLIKLLIAKWSEFSPLLLNCFNTVVCFSSLRASLADLRHVNLCVDAINGEQTALCGANHVKLILGQM